MTSGQVTQFQLDSLCPYRGLYWLLCKLSWNFVDSSTKRYNEETLSDLHVVFVRRVVAGHHGEADQAEAGGGPRLGGGHDHDGARPPPAGATAGAEVSH